MLRARLLDGSPTRVWYDGDGGVGNAPAGWRVGGLVAGGMGGMVGSEMWEAKLRLFLLQKVPLLQYQKCPSLTAKGDRELWGGRIRRKPGKG